MALNRFRLRVERLTAATLSTWLLYIGSFGVFAAMYHHVRHQYEIQEVRSAAGRVRGALLEVESGQRGFLLTGKEQYLDNYRFYRKILRYRLEILCKMIPVSEANRVNCHELGQLVAWKLDEMESTVAAMRKGDSAEAFRIIRTDKGLAWTGEIEMRLDQIRIDNTWSIRPEATNCIVQ
jgi:CHASE3 domain sensor protein